MDKIDLNSRDILGGNVEKIAELFPGVVTEAKDEATGELKKVVDFDLLRQHLSDELVEGDRERFRLDWPGKKASILKANTPTDKTLRPVREDSEDFDTTENVFIEGDNFEVLKVLQESYLGKVKMIYIDPPYNTGTAMLYNNDFSESKGEYGRRSGALSEGGVKMTINSDTNGRYHSDWLSMMHERVLVARDLLKDDGIFVIAIDHNELNNLISICDDTFGEDNRLGIVTVVHKSEGRNQEKFFGTSNEFALFYAKDAQRAEFNRVALDESVKKEFKLEDASGLYKLNNYRRDGGGDHNLRTNKSHFFYPIYVSSNLEDISTEPKPGYEEVLPITNTGQERTWKTKKETFQERLSKGLIIATREKSRIVVNEKYYEDQVIKTHWVNPKYHAIHYGTKVVEELLEHKTFDFPKSLRLIIDTIKLTTSEDDITLDFFSGSGTTAHAVMQLNAEDGGSRKHIQVQLAEPTDEKSEAYKVGYKTIPEISRERIRRAGKKIREDNAEQIAKRVTPLDTGFRAYRLSSSNFKDTALHPNDTTQQTLLDVSESIKEDRTADDLLTEVILSLGLTLDLPIETRNIAGHNVYFVGGNSLVACFDDNVSLDIVDDIAAEKPLRVVFKDSSFESDEVRINVDIRLKQLSPDTAVQVV